MKKTTLKVFGVCAATLLTIGAVAPVAVHAEETAAIEARSNDNRQTPNNLKTDAKINIARIGEFQKLMQKAVNNTIVSGQNQKKSIALESVNTGILKELFNDGEGLVGGNMGLNLYDPNNQGIEDVVNTIFGKKPATFVSATLDETNTDETGKDSVPTVGQGNQIVLGNLANQEVTVDAGKGNKVQSITLEKPVAENATVKINGTEYTYNGTAFTDESTQENKQLTVNNNQIVLGDLANQEVTVNTGDDDNKVQSITLANPLNNDDTVKINGTEYTYNGTAFTGGDGETGSGTQTPAQPTVTLTFTPTQGNIVGDIQVKTKEGAEVEITPKEDTNNKKFTVDVEPNTEYKVYNNNVLIGTFATKAEDGELTVTSQSITPAVTGKGIYMTSNFAMDGNIYQAGDKVNIKFWTDYGIGTSNQLRQIGETTVTFTGEDEAGDFTATANTLNGVVGQEYLPYANLTVKNNNTGVNLQPVVLVEVDQGNQTKAVAYLAKNGSEQVLNGPEGPFNSVTKFVNALQTTTEKDMNSVYSAIENEFGYGIGDFYFLYDQSNFVAGNRVRVEQDTVNGIVRGTKFIYNTAVSDYNQNLRIVVPYFTNDDTETPNVESNYVSRLINVTEDGETPIPEETKVPVYRAYNPNNGDHLFTTSMKEYQEVVDKGWAPEGLAWNAASKEDGEKPVYRLYNPNSGEHFYTDSEKEYNEVGAAGWKQEGIAFYSASVEGGVKIYRSFNPNATGPGSHMFTDSEKEYNELTAAGWSPEGVAFYGIK